LGVGVWGMGPTPQPPIPNPQSPIPNPQSPKKKYLYYKIINKLIFFILILINIMGCCFLFPRRYRGGGGDGLVKKPVLYLYPEKEIDVEVKLSIKNSEFTCVYPKFEDENECKWKVKANPNGELSISGKKYPYLFWEAESYKSQDFNEGFIVKSENAEEFLEEKLKILGLNDKESSEFITYWLPVLIKNKMSICSFQTEQFLDNFKYEITPKPDSFLRVFLSIKKIDKEINIKEQNLKGFKREGFVAVEWGGSNIQN